MSKPPGNTGEGEMASNDSSRIEPKRSHQCFMDGAEAQLLPNKRLAAEVLHPNSYTALLNSNIYCGSPSSFPPVASQITERLFENGTIRSSYFEDWNLSSIAIGSKSLGSKDIVDPFGIGSTFGLSISNSLVEPQSSISYGGIRKFKVSQVKDANDFISVSLGHAYSTGDAYCKADDESVTMGISFDRVNDGLISMTDTFNRVDNNFIPMCESYRENNASIYVDPSASMDISSITTLAESFIKEDENNISMDIFNIHNNALSMDHVFSKEVDDIRMLMNKADNNGLSMRHTFGKGENNIISVGGLNDGLNINSSGRLVCNYDFLMGQPSVQRLEENGLCGSTSDVLFSGVKVTTPGDAISKRKEQKSAKKIPPNNFPSNVRSLLSTGMLDGVPVKYVAWSQEKELRGVIKGASYLCGCQSCTYSKAINAYEFERHAGCKTKHPNNHIYFDNGKTIYGVVQELRNTPRNVLFEVIQTITGSPINQRSFQLWKDSFLAASRELQRIYGREEGKIVS